MEDVRGKVDIKTAAQMLGLSPEGVRKRIQRGLLKAEKVENRWLVVLPTRLEDVRGKLEDNPDKVGDQLDERSNLSRTGLEVVVNSSFR